MGFLDPPALTKLQADRLYAQQIEPINAASAVSGPYLLPDVTTATIHDLTIIGDTQLVFPVPASGKSFRLKIKMDGVGGHLVSFPVIEWNNSAAPTVSSGSLAIDLYEFRAVGGRWFGFVIGQNMGIPRLPLNTTPPSITGSTIQGGVLTANKGVWTAPGTSFTYQWLSGGAPINGATSATYTLSASEVASRMTVTVTTTNAMGTTSATSLPTAQVTAPASGVVKYIRTAAAGSADGSSWDNAGAISSLDSMISGAGAGGRVYIRADEGNYSVTSTINIAHGGTAGNPVAIQGVDVNGADMAATFVGNRTAWTLPTDSEQTTDVTGWTIGAQPFKLVAGANNLTWKNLAFQKMGTGCIRVAAPLSNLTFDTLSFYNVQSFFEQTFSSPAAVATVTGLTMQNCSGVGFSKKCVRIRYDTNDVLVQNCVFNSGRQDKDNFAVGIEMNDTAHNIYIINVSCSNCHDSFSTPYWNADGFSSEAGNYNLTLVGCTSFGNTDGGFDFKGAPSTLINCLSYDNKRNFRLWGLGQGDHDLFGFTSRDPHIRGGNGDPEGGVVGAPPSPCHIFSDQGGDVFLHSGAIVDTGPNHNVFSLHNGAIVRRVMSDVTLASSGSYTGASDGGYFIFELGDVVDTTPPVFTGTYTSHTLEKQPLAQVMTVTEPFAVPNVVQSSGITLRLSGGADKALMSFATPNLTMAAKDYAFDLSAGHAETYVGIVRARDAWRNSTLQEVDFVIDQDTSGAPVTTRYIAPAPAGLQNGATIADAAAMSSLNTLISQVGPDGEVRILADHGNYSLTASTVAWIKTGGTPGHPVTIRGWNGATNTEQEAVFVGTRTTWTAPDTYQPIVASGFGGNTLYVLGGNANNLVFRYLNPKAFIRVFDFSDQTLDSISFEHIDFYNIRDGLYTNSASNLSNISIDAVNAIGVSKKVIRCHGQSHEWTVENCIWDSRWQDKDNFYVGLEIYDTAHDITVNDCTSCNGQDTNGTTSYWNSDGFSSEVGNYNITYNRCTSYSHTDGGFDNKARNVVYNNCLSYDNKKNFRLWSHTNDDGTPGAVLNGCHSRDPFWRGGSESAMHLWQADTVSLDPSYVDSNHNRGGNGANIVVKNTVIENTLPDPQPHRSTKAVSYDNGGTGNILRWSNDNIVTQSTPPTQAANNLVFATDLTDVTVPTITSTDTVNCYNKGTVDLALTASKPVSWRIVGGADAAIFSIQTGTGQSPIGVVNQVGKVLHMTTSTYTGTSADTKVVQVQAMDDNLNVSSVQTVTVTVLADFPPYTFRSRFEGLNGATTLVAETGQTITFNSNAKLTTTNPIEGTSSLLLDGVDDNVTVPDSDDWAFGRLFSVIAKINMSALPVADGQIVGQLDSSSATDAWALRVTAAGELAFTYGTSGTQSASILTTGLGLQAGVTYEVAVDRDEADTLRFYVNGSVVKSAQLSQAFPNSAFPLRMGTDNSINRDFAGRIDDVRIWKGYAFCASDGGYTVS